MKRFLAATFLTLATSISVQAQERPNTILVMDGSGSMWGQIDGVAKITIAQDVVRNILNEFPTDQGLGLTVYGHRERGVCTDIETVVAPAPGTAGQIVDAVNGIKPLGKTPMTDAVIAAAQALRYTEDKATVILVSDGVETCNPDPCAAARLLEEAGIDFTAHVVGFDVGSDADALAQMQCIANETGGQFLTADTADQLTAALTQVAVAEPEPEPEPVLIPVTLTAAIEGTPDLVEGPVIWDIEGAGGLVADDVPGNPIAGEVVEGSYVATAYSTALEMALSQQFIAVGDAVSVEIAFPAPLPTARLIAPAEAPAGSTIQVGWEAMAEADDYIGIGAIDADGAAQWQNYTHVRDGNPLSLLVPPQEGPYLIQYFNGQTRQPLGEAQIIATPLDVAVTAPAEAIAGSVINVDWVGPDYADDYIGIGLAGADGAEQWVNWARTRDGSPAQITVPAVEGTYTVKYFAAQGRFPLAETTVAVTLPPVTVTAPAEAVAGSVIEVAWEGPDYEDDYIGIGLVGANGAQQWLNWAHTKDGSPARITVPAVEGDYLVKYFAREGRTPLAEAPVRVTLPQTSVSAPAEAVAGSVIEVEWVGPDYTDDYIGIGLVGANGAQQWLNWARTSDGSPARITVPAVEGDYLVKYFAREGRTPLAEAPVRVTLPQTSITAPAEAVAGSVIEVEWVGPDYTDDYIGIGLVGANGAQQWLNWARTKDGSPARITVPAVEGDYLVKYFAREGRTPLAEAPVRVTLPQTSVSAPTQAVAGTVVEVEWVGPDYQDDYIGIGLVGAKGAQQWLNWVRSSDGSPAQLTMPAIAGDYVIKYFAREGRTPLAETPISLTAPSASVSAPDRAIAGSTIEVVWDGPEYTDDYIGIGPVGAGGARQWANWAATSDGSPASLLVPPVAGEYVIKYFARQGRVPLAETTIAVDPVEASLEAPASAAAGSTIEITWEGPNYEGDYIGIGPVGASGAQQWRVWSATSDGSPASIALPEDAGDYVIRYFVRQGRTSVAEVPLTIQ